MTTIILVRHGQSTANLENRVIGQTDVPLTALGHQQAEELGAWLASCEHVDAIYASDLCRAYDTVLPLANRLGLPVSKTPELREKDMGHWVGYTMAEIQSRYPEEYHAWKQDRWLFRPQGGESLADVALRMHSFVERAVRAHTGKTVLIGTHAGVIRAFDRTVRQANGIQIEAQHIPVDNTSLHYYETDGNGIRCLKSNVTEHLTRNSVSERTFE